MQRKLAIFQLTLWCWAQCTIAFNQFSVIQIVESYQHKQYTINRNHFWLVCSLSYKIHHCSCSYTKPKFSFESLTTSIVVHYDCCSEILYVYANNVTKTKCTTFFMIWTSIPCQIELSQRMPTPNIKHIKEAEKLNILKMVNVLQCII